MKRQSKSGRESLSGLQVSQRLIRKYGSVKAVLKENEKLQKMNSTVSAYSFLILKNVNSAGGLFAKFNPSLFDVSLLVGLDDDPADSDHRLHLSHLSGLSRVRFLLAFRTREQLRASLHRHGGEHYHGHNLRH